MSRRIALKPSARWRRALAICLIGLLIGMAAFLLLSKTKWQARSPLWHGNERLGVRLPLSASSRMPRYPIRLLIVRVDREGAILLRHSEKPLDLAELTAELERGNEQTLSTDGPSAPFLGIAADRYCRAAVVINLVRTAYNHGIQRFWFVTLPNERYPVNDRLSGISYFVHSEKELSQIPMAPGSSVQDLVDWLACPTVTAVAAPEKVHGTEPEKKAEDDETKSKP